MQRESADIVNLTCLILNEVLQVVYDCEFTSIFGDTGRENCKVFEVDVYRFFDKRNIHLFEFSVFSDFCEQALH